MWTSSKHNYSYGMPLGFSMLKELCWNKRIRPYRPETGFPRNRYFLKPKVVITTYHLHNTTMDFLLSSLIAKSLAVQGKHFIPYFHEYASFKRKESRVVVHSLTTRYLSKRLDSDLASQTTNIQMEKPREKWHSNSSTRVQFFPFVQRKCVRGCNFA